MMIIENYQKYFREQSQLRRRPWQENRRGMGNLIQDRENEPE